MEAFKSILRPHRHRSYLVFLLNSKVTHFVLLLLIILGVFSLRAYASTKTATNQVTFSGLEKTKESYAQAVFRDCLHHYEDLSVALSTYLEQCFFNTRLFKTVTVVEQQQSGTYHITVEEKWSLIPIPFIQGGSGENQTVGFFLLDTNFTGRGKVLALGGSKSSNGSMLFLMSKDPSVSFSHWNLGLSFTYGAKDIFLYEKEEKYSGLYEDKVSARPSVGYKIGNFSPSLQFVHSTNKFNETKDQKNVLKEKILPEDFRSNQIGLDLSYKSFNYKLYYEEGIKAHGSYLREIQRSDDLERFLSTFGQIDFGLSSVKDHALLVRIQAGMVESGGISDVFRRGAGKGFRGAVAESLWLERFSALSIDYQVPVHNFSFATLTLAPFTDVGQLQMRGGHQLNFDFKSYGLGTYLFLTGVAIPGLGIEIGKSDQFQDRFINFSLGLAQ